MGAVGLCSHRVVDSKAIFSVLENEFVGSSFIYPSPWKIELQQYILSFLFVWHSEGTVASQKHCFNLFAWRLSPALLPAWKSHPRQ